MEAWQIAISGIEGVTATNVQGALQEIKGQANWAAEQVGGITYTLNDAVSRLNSVEGTAQYAADNVGFLDYHLREIAARVGYTMPAAA